jgi:hypothetical protein
MYNFHPKYEFEGRDIIYLYTDICRVSFLIKNFKKTG